MTCSRKIETSSFSAYMEYHIGQYFQYSITWILGDCSHNHRKKRDKVGKRRLQCCGQCG